MSALENYDLRVDWAPTPGSLVSVSWFRKNVERPIEYVQQVVLFTYTTPVNYPSGKLEGFEFEVRQNMGDIVEGLDGLTLGANATLLESSVRLPQEEIDELSLPNINAPIVSRDMTGAPAYLYNLFATYSLAETGTDFAIAYSVQGDTLIAGAGTNPPNFVPSVYALPYGTLNMSITQKLGDIFRLSLAIKNLTNPDIEEVYRSPYIGDDVLKTSFTRGIDFSVSLSASFTF
jgi:outer membrane receptor protein involved in Fe transport